MVWSGGPVPERGVSKENDSKAGIIVANIWLCGLDKLHGYLASHEHCLGLRNNTQNHQAALEAKIGDKGVRVRHLKVPSSPTSYHSGQT